MEKKKLHNTLEYGDVVAIDLGYYQHFGIYIGDYQMIHYYPEENGDSGKITVHITQFETFLGGEEEYFICDFSSLEETACNKVKVESAVASLSTLIEPRLNLSEEFERAKGIQIAFATAKYHLYSPEETVARAYSRLGDTCCDLLQENCEYFIIWCKTGISDTYESSIVMKWLKKQWNIK